MVVTGVAAGSHLEVPFLFECSALRRRLFFASRHSREPDVRNEDGRRTSGTTVVSLASMICLARAPAWLRQCEKF